MVHRLLGCLFFFLLLSGCVNSPVVDEITLDRVIVRNETGSLITDLKIHFEPTRKIGRVNTILPQRAVEVGFSSQPMLAKEATLIWTDGSGMTTEVKVSLPMSPLLETGRDNMSLVYTIDSQGAVLVHLE
jgi:hypothetical protein